MMTFLTILGMVLAVGLIGTIGTLLFLDYAIGPDDKGAF